MGVWTNTDFKVSSACTLVVESEERVLAMQSLKSIAGQPFAPGVSENEIL
jgi:hypothetical protein